MSAFIAIGIGCRKNCPGSAIAALVREVLAGADMPQLSRKKLFSIIDKQDEPGLLEAAEMLKLDIAFLPREALAAQNDHIQTQSTLALATFGIASVSEAAALAGAGIGAKLIVPRRSVNGATCAIAMNSLEND